MSPLGFATELDTANPALSTWNKQIKSNSKDFPHFKDEAFFHKFKDKTESVTKMFNLEHAIDDDDDYVPSNPDLDSAQMNWLHNAWESTITVPSAKAILIKNRDEKNTRVIWKEITTTHARSQATEIRIGSLMSFVSANQFNTSN